MGNNIYSSVQIKEARPPSLAYLQVGTFSMGDGFWWPEPPSVTNILLLGVYAKRARIITRKAIVKIPATARVLQFPGLFDWGEQCGYFLEREEFEESKVVNDTQFFARKTFMAPNYIYSVFDTRITVQFDREELNNVTDTIILRYATFSGISNAPLPTDV